MLQYGQKKNANFVKYITIYQERSFFGPIRKRYCLMTVYTAEEIKKQLKYIRLMAKEYPNIQSACTEIINLQAILQLPKGTEHFMSDLHGEHEAFTHILNNCSGVIKTKIDSLLSKSISQQERSELATLIYYPQLKLAEIKKREENYEDWCRITLYRLIDICRLVASKYTRSKVRKALPADYSYIIDELINADYSEHNKEEYYGKIIDTILSLDRADGFIIAMSNVIKRLAVDRLHIIGDIFDRGERPDIIIDMLMNHHAVDIQWGNHDVLWMGAAAGSTACIANVIGNCLRYNNLEVLEMGYGINLRPLTLFAQDVYQEAEAFLPKYSSLDAPSEKDLSLLSKMLKAITIIRFKLEGQIIRRHPEYDMEDRLYLDKIDQQSRTVLVAGKPKPLKDCDFPTLLPEEPYELTPEERLLMENLRSAFLHCDKLQRQINFLFEEGSMYKCHNGNLLFHSCVPLKEDGSFDTLTVCDKELSGKKLMDTADFIVREAYYSKSGSIQKEYSLDFIWYLWCGKKSPLFGRERMTSFERFYLSDKSTWTEPQNPYYSHLEDEAACVRILEEFGLPEENSHIINGHVPVRLISGESPLKANGRLIVIDGGLCKAYQSRTGIAGYTLIYNSHGMRLVAHQPFDSLQNAIEKNIDIHSSSDIFETLQNRMKVKDTDIGLQIRDKIEDLNMLVCAYQMGLL